MQLEPGPFEQVGGSGRMDAAHMAQHCVSGKTHAIAGIGHPRRFFDQLLNLAILNAREHAYPDHHEYRAADFADKQGTLLMTEKDAIKCERLELQDAWYLPVNAELPEPFEQAFVSRVRQITSAAGEPS